MNETSSYDTIPTLISLWGAMLGGAIGATAGKLTSNVACNGTIGLVVGAIAGVLMYTLLFVPVYMVATYLARIEFGEHTIGGHPGDWLAGVLGGTAGLCGAVIVTAVLPSKNLRDPHAFAVCWSVVTFVPLLLVLVNLWHARRA